MKNKGRANASEYNPDDVAEMCPAWRFIESLFEQVSELRSQISDQQFDLGLDKGEK